MLRVVSPRCVARDLHTIPPGHFTVRVGDGSRRSGEIVKNLEFAPLNAIIVVIVVVVVIIIGLLYVVSSKNYFFIAVT